MGSLFADRISDVPRSFIREILKVTVDREIISFAGGLPNRDLFPVREIEASISAVMRDAGRDALQYETSEGYAPLRAWIADRYRKRMGLSIDPAQILITTGSQQGLDLLGKTLLNDGDQVLVEEPSYLGAIQAMSLYRPNFITMPLGDDGPDPDVAADCIRRNKPKLAYLITCFHNPSGISYGHEARRAVAEAAQETGTLLVEDNAYHELRFMGEDQPSLAAMAPEQTVLLGSFSKIVVPSFRIGWIATTRADLMDKLVVAKQASDLHTNYFGQRVVEQYLRMHDIDEHIATIRGAYRRQRDAMVAAIGEHFPAGVRFTRPEGGMFLWITLPGELSSMQLFDRASREKVVFVPGNPFYVHGHDMPTARLSFSCVDEATIRTGIARLGRVLREVSA